MAERAAGIEGSFIQNVTNKKIKRKCSDITRILKKKKFPHKDN